MGLLTNDAIEVERLLREVAGDDLGGTAVFIGTVRRSDEDGPVVAIEYSAYEGMAEQEFAKILAEVGERWPAVRIAARHRVGRVPTGQPSVVIAAGSPHRAEAFEACRYMIEEVKHRVPIWKQEFFEGGARSWRSGHGAAAAGGHVTPRGARTAAPGSE